MDDVRRRG
jgi:hypothetical protein